MKLTKSQVMSGREFRQRRKALGLNQRELAHELECAVETISRWETGEWEITKRVALALKGLESERAA